MEEVGTTGGRKIIWLSYSMMKDWGRRDITDFSRGKSSLRGRYFSQRRCARIKYRKSHTFRPSDGKIDSPHSPLSADDAF